MSGLNEAMRHALIAAHRRGPVVSFGTKDIYEPVMHPGTAYALERRGLAAVDPAYGSRSGWSSGTLRLTATGREVAARLSDEAYEAERARLAALDLSPPRRGHLRVVAG